MFDQRCKDDPKISCGLSHLEHLNICFSYKKQEQICNTKTIASKIQSYQ